ncbi:MAG: hypothetical protein VB092_03295 [Oscillospiraceae bacterium]|nr:hypothetical protein [Oscillospiraceae bacterium]
MDKTEIERIAAMLAPRLSEPVARAAAPCADTVTELRFRAGRPVCIRCGAQTRFVRDGRCVESADDCLLAQPQELQQTLARLSEYSLYAKQPQLGSGYLTIRGGHRVGIAASETAGGVDFGSINALNIRIARAVPGCADAVVRRTQAERRASVLWVSLPGAGKTTLLRDAVRQLASPQYLQRISLIDERRELAGVSQGAPTLDVGLLTDVLDGYARKDGIPLAVRALAPDFIACDEIGGAADMEALADAHRCGVLLLASIHAPELHALRACRYFDVLRGVFDYAVLVRSAPAPGTIAAIERMESL